MQYCRCKCGEAEFWGSYYAPRCMGCEKCGTTLDSNSSMHQKPEPHKPRTIYDSITGQPYQICEVCNERLDTPKKKSQYHWAPIVWTRESDVTKPDRVEIRLVHRILNDGKTVCQYVVKKDNYCVAKDGKWKFDAPSHYQTDEFLESCMFDDFESAKVAIDKVLQELEHETTDKDGPVNQG